MSSINILGLDASADCCSVALKHNGIIKEIHSQSRTERSQKLLLMIQELLNNIQIDELTALAFAAGPGSLTGLKIASSIIQALNFVYKKPIIKISTLQAISLQVFEKCNAKLIMPKLIMPCIDAKMGQLYYGIYSFSGDTDNFEIQTIKEDTLGSPEQIFIDNKDILIVSDNTYEPMHSNASSIVKLASYWYKKHGIISNDANPNYLRAYD